MTIANVRYLLSISTCIFQQCTQHSGARTTQHVINERTFYIENISNWICLTTLLSMLLSFDIIAFYQLWCSKPYLDVQTAKWMSKNENDLFDGGVIAFWKCHLWFVRSKVSFEYSTILRCSSSLDFRLKIIVRLIILR